MLSKALLPLFLGCSPAIGSILTPQALQEPLGIWNHPSSAPAKSESSTSKAPSYRDDLLALHKHLVEISSVTGTEHDVGDFLVDYFTSKSWHYEIEAVAPKNNTPEGKDRFNVVAWPPSSSQETTRLDPKVLVTSHIDVVPPHIPYSIAKGEVTEDTVIAGRGSVDAKGSVAAQLTAVEDLLAAGELAPEDVMVLYVVGEEQGGDGMRVFSEARSSSLNFKAAIFGEPTENKLACGHKGGMTCEVEAKGKAGHSGYPWLGKSANEVLMRGLLKMLDTDLGSSERYGNTTVNIGKMEGGVALNVIPAHASASLMCRVALEPQESGHKDVIAKMEEVLASVDDEALSLACSTGSGVVACDCDVDGFDTIVANYGTDIPYLKGDHVRYLYGPGTIMVAHGDDEALTVGDLEDAVEGFKTLILHALEL
ncbi:hypothetical protein VMCG_10404 [Cytospora schulzeri]|uniref:Peptidase M20 dimerisation domain-containing protein n=1 Tax=Cytospora schulzeri TaxID=448051 RepID=A0A423VAZ9_9PEZI|nr:hypothetical protein VMCG_10404 [Valsa malicola]